jgi:hypothetical protein
MDSPATLSKPDISTLLGLGHFYFVLTSKRFVEKVCRTEKRTESDSRVWHFRCVKYTEEDVSSVVEENAKLLRFPRCTM